MNKLVISILLLLTQLSLQAQTEKGRFTIGAQIANLTYQDQNGARNISASINPSAGYFVADGLVIGTGIPLSLANGKSTISNAYAYYNNNSFSLGLAPFVRYFVGQRKLKPYVGIAYSYSRLTSNSDKNDPTGLGTAKGKGQATSLVPTLGIAYFVSRTLGLTLGLNYTIGHQNQDIDYTMNNTYVATSSSDSQTKTFSLGIGFQLFVGK